MNKPLVSAVLILAAAFASGGAASPAYQRHQNFELIGRANKGIHDQLRKRPVDLAAVRNTANVLATLASRVKTWFPAGSTSKDTLPAAWTNRAELDRQADRFAAAARNLATVAEGGDTAAIQVALRATGETCKSCHDQFRRR